MSAPKNRGKKNGPETTPNAGADAQPVKKPRRSAGFIETSGFKPSWLETGPLPADAADARIQGSEQTRVQLTPEQFEALQAAMLQHELLVDDPSSPDNADVQPLTDTEQSFEAPLETMPQRELQIEDLAAPQSAGNRSDKDTEQASVATSDEPAGVLEPGVDVASTMLVATSAESPAPEEDWMAARELQEAAEVETGRAEQVVPVEPVPGPPPSPSAESEGLADVDATEAALEASLAPIIESSSVIESTTSVEYRALEAAMIDAHVPEETETLEAEVLEPAELVSDHSPAPHADHDGKAIADATGATTKTSPTPVAERPHRRRARRSPVPFLVAILLLLGAAVVYFANPFARLALATATIAQPSTPSALSSPDMGEDWCITGDFLPSGSEPLGLNDGGQQGDMVSGDLVHSLDYVIATPGSYQWHVVACENPELSYPQAPAWIHTSQPNQPTTFVFDSRQAEERLFLTVPFAVSASDSAGDYRVIGSFQDWNVADPSNQLTAMNSRLYQQVRRLAEAGTYEAYLFAGDLNQAFDAYGRTSNPNPFSFGTQSSDDYVVFLLDADQGRASVLYDMTPALAELAFGNGHIYLSAGLLILGALLLLGLLLRMFLLRSSGPWLERGCPQCGEHELMRVARHSNDRTLQRLGIPAYRYRCRQCTWEGLRLSEEGTSTSPGVTVAKTRF